jgi:uncharacterized protein
MYYLTIRQFMRSLKNLDAVLAKAEAHATARKFDVNNFFSARLYPDMLPFSVQVRIACDAAKLAGSLLSDKPAPAHEDNETTFADLRGRIGKCMGYLETLTAKDFEKTTPDMIVKLKGNGGRPDRTLRANEFLLARQIPNFYFHVTTAYDLLRHGGVEIGKGDYLGQLEYLEA